MIKNKINIFSYCFLIITTLTLFYFNYLIYTNHMFMFKNLHLYILIISIIVSLTLFFLVYKFGNKAIVLVLIILLLIVVLFMVFKIHNTTKTFKAMNERAKKTKRENLIEVLVLKESKYNTIEDLYEKSILGFIKDEEDIKRTLKEYSELKIDYKSGINIYKSLMNKETDAIVLSSKSSSLMTDESIDLDSFRTIYSKEIVPKADTKEKKIDNIKKIKSYEGDKVFNIYISGADTYGSINTVSRSDVNIIASVNLNTGKVLLITTPRDSYVRIAGDGNNEYDKLTHAGVYGVKSSIETLENLYDIDIDYYVRVNFDSAMHIIDLFDGVDVYNDQDFVSFHSGIHFKKGIVHLDSTNLLPFIRERYSLVHGDHDRGRNQQKVITAVINKIAKPNYLISRGESIFIEGSKYVETDIEFKQIMKWVNYVIDSNTKFEVKNVSVSGTGSMGLRSYAMPGYKLYMFKINESSLNDVKNQIKELASEKK